VARVAAEMGVVCQASLEQPMACGMGTCQSCIIKYRPHTAAAGTEWVYKLTCTDGPVFDTRDLVW
jgi:dihydroorotate dehydrogenase electron transfer subunit